MKVQSSKFKVQNCGSFLTKTLMFLTSTFLILTFTPYAYAQTATLSLNPASGTFNQGCSFSLNVDLDTGGVETDGTDAILIYDTSRFAATSITKGTIYPDYPGNNIDAESGKITISGLASVSTPFKGKGTLATVNFTVGSKAATGATQIKFDFDPRQKDLTTDSNVVQRYTVVDVLNTVVNGDYTIGTNSCGAQASAVPTSTGSVPGGTIIIPAPPGQGQIGTPAAQYKPLPPKTIDQLVDQTGNGPGTPQLTFALTIVGGVLTVLGILGLALL